MQGSFGGQRLLKHHRTARFVKICIVHLNDGHLKHIAKKLLDNSQRNTGGGELSDDVSACNDGPRRNPLRLEQLPH